MRYKCVFLCFFLNIHLLPSLQYLQLSAYVGISRIAALLGWLKPDLFGGAVPKEVELRQLSHLCNPSHMSAVFHEHLLLNTSFVQMNEVWQIKTFPTNISVSVINSRKFEKILLNFKRHGNNLSCIYVRVFTLHACIM
ncbi:uncharacterized protein TNCT_229381 [Trichonephila clavata]|uniref:Secreted protein n=1 Tax=Trichonephila clavata TaxID=2740835 RepID=A0A8X6GLU0_TRICU|nr:uncharacterized protein TNCT_229381 [Trichonephila clavata]